jgi:phosphoribosylformylglycinamidine cyclo-ligase
MKYAESGVDYRKEDAAVRKIVSRARGTFKNRKGKIGEVMCDIGSFANLMDFGRYAIAFTTDGVGSKVLVAHELKKYDTVGIDCVAMNVNDLLCVGAEPVAMVDYMALNTPYPWLTEEIAKGLVKGANMAGIALVGGETASLPDIIKGDDEFDLAGSAIGIVKKSDIITGSEIVPGDVVVGLKSSGIHSNGLTLARECVPQSMWHELLIPTKIYVDDMLWAFDEFNVKGVANITGGGMLNLCRLTKYGFMLDNMPKPQRIFDVIQKNGKVPMWEMYTVFNMGVGMCFVIGEDEIDKLNGIDFMYIGRVVDGCDVTVVKDKERIKLEKVMY